MEKFVTYTLEVTLLAPASEQLRKACRIAASERIENLHAAMNFVRDVTTSSQLLNSRFGVSVEYPIAPEGGAR